MRGVATIGKKGGTGKTTLAHLLALGACWKGVPTHFMHTDDRAPIKINGRPYLYYDARDPDNLKTLINMAVNNDGLFVLDGGGNRPVFDAWVADLMDLVLIPVTPDPEDVRMAIEHMKGLEGQGYANVRYVLNKIPSNKLERRYIDRYLSRLQEDKIICPLPEMRTVRILREDDDEPFATPPSKVNNLARLLFTRINHFMDQAEKAEMGEAA